MSVRREDDEIRDFLRELGARIRDARLAAGIDTVAEFSRRVGADRSSIARWEAGSGAPDAVNLRAIARETGASLDWLLRGQVSVAWREALEAWAATARPDARARMWLESLPLDGFPANPAFYDLAHVAYRHGLSVAQTIQMAVENLDADRELARRR